MKRGVVFLITALTVAGAVRAEPLELEQAVVDRILEIRAVDPQRRDDAFSKMGGSSVASKAFLQCFATQFVDLGDRPELGKTIDYFNAAPRSSFSRPSEAAGVSWNLRYVLGGRPANFRQELAATQARWALVLFGGNDAQNENERVYLKRLVYLVEQLAEMGVVPVLGSAMPRRNAHKNRWIERFNLITEAVAKHWSLPYIDYHAELSALPRKGLARDGVHPNVLPPGGYQSSCQLTDEGLRYGNNVRNLLTLEMLDALRRAVANASPKGAEGGLREGVGARVGVVGRDRQAPKASGWVGLNQTADAGTAAAAGTAADAAADAAPAPDPFPISDLLDTASLPAAGALPQSCGPTKPASRHYAVELKLIERTRLRVSALDLDGHKPRVLAVRHDEETGERRCVRRRSETLELDASPGTWELIVEVPEKAAEEGRMLILVAREPR